jgi:biopolymer transport protein ExbD
MPKLEPMSNGSARMGGRRARGRRVSSSLAEINVVPLVDVMLVLLVIFMVAAPMLQQGFAVNLPKSSQSKAISAPLTVTIPVTFRRDHRVQVGNEWVPFPVLGERVKQALNDRGDTTKVIVAGDGGVTLSETFQVMDKLNQSGVTQAMLQTQPGASAPPPSAAESGK